MNDRKLIEMENKQAQIDRREIPYSILLQYTDSQKSIFSVHNVDLLDVMKFYKHEMTAKQRRIYKLYYESGLTQIKIAKKTGISRPAVQRHLEAIRKKARTAFFMKKI